MVAESWFRGLWKTSRKHDSDSQKAVIGVLAFEVACLMSKLVNMWQSLSDKHINRLREEITNSVGIRKLVSDDENFIAHLISLEMLENMAHVSESVARLGRKCSDPSLKGFEIAFHKFIIVGFDPYEWKFTSKKMEKKVKRMEKFISTSASLYQEMEVLSDLEQTLRRMKANCESDGENLIEYQKKVAWKRHEVKNLKDISLWNRTYDYAVHILARSLFTIFIRINNVFGVKEIIDVGGTKISHGWNANFLHGGQSVSAILQSSVCPSENDVSRFASGPLRGFPTKSGPFTRTNRTSIFRSGPLGDSSAKSGPISAKYGSDNFHSGTLGRNLKKADPVNRTNKNSKIWKFHGQSTTISGKEVHTISNRPTQLGPFKGCMAADSTAVTDFHSGQNDHYLVVQNSKYANQNLIAPENVAHYNQSVFSSLCKLSNPPPGTLGAASLALHYANVIIVIEKLAASPHLIGLDARDDLYNMLTRRVRAALRAKLKPYNSKTMASSVYDASLAEEWTGALSSILEWLAPLAHNMIRWQSERSFEQQSFVSRTNVLLVQTLYFANQEKTEATVSELLVGLNYIWRYARELNAKALAECCSSRVDNEFLI